MIYARLFATARFIRPSSVGVPFCEAALSGTPQPMVYPQTTPTIRQTGFSSISARLVAPKLPSEGGRKKFIRSQAFPGVTTRYYALRKSRGTANTAAPRPGIPRSAIRIPHLDIPIQMSKNTRPRLTAYSLRLTVQRTLDLGLWTLPNSSNQRSKFSHDFPPCQDLGRKNIANAVTNSGDAVF
jgi:hypothetical protein